MTSPEECSIAITDERQLDELLDYIHDCFFDVDDIEWSPEHSVLKVPYVRKLHSKTTERSWLGLPKYAEREEKWVLVFSNVLSYSINDTEQVGQYDFNRLRYDHNSRTLTVDTGIPLGFEIVVGDVNIVCCSAPV